MLVSELAAVDVAILGAGREGRAVLRRIRREFPGKKLTFYTEAEVGEDFASDFAGPENEVVVAPFDAATLARHDVIVRSPGISPYREALIEARRHGVRFTSATSLWFAEHRDARTICITGTKGKSTTSALTAHLLRSAGLRVRLAGNIGEPLLDCDDTDIDWWVIELSSYQLADLEGQPTIAVVLNLSDEHLDWHGSPETYRRDKMRIAELGAEVMVANFADAGLRDYLEGSGRLAWFNNEDGVHVQAGRLFDGKRALHGDWTERLPGCHNLANLAAALTILRAAGVAWPGLDESLASFTPLPHRLERLGERDGLVWVNDSLSTTPVATLAALEFLSGREVTLLVGGLDRGVDWSEAVEKMRGQLPHAIITLPDSGPAIAALARRKGLEPPGGIVEAENLSAALQLARELTPAGGVVLLSPGAPSFPHFRDYADRGLQFACLAGFSRQKKRSRG